MTRTLYAICVAIALVVVIPFVGNASLSRADFTYVNPSGIHTLDPARMSWTNDFRIALNLWEGLTSWHPQTLRPIAGAAMFPPEVSSDGTLYRFQLRPDTRWSNGDKVTAADFVRGWRRAIEPGTGTDYTFLFVDHIAGVEDYVRYRRHAIDVLAALNARSKGRDISAEQARTLAGYHATWTTLLNAPRATIDQWDVPARAALPNTAVADHTRPESKSTSLHWPAVYQRVRSAHAHCMDKRFARVGFRAVDDQTLEVRLLRPCAYFLDLTGFPAFLPCHQSIEQMRIGSDGLPIDARGLVIYNPQWTKPGGATPGYLGLITNGPYSLADWTFKRRLRLAVNPHHRLADAINCRTVDMLVYDNINAAIMAYEAGGVDFLPSMNVPYEHEIARLATSGERPDFKLCNVLATYFFNFNCADDSVDGVANPFVDARVRRAFAMAVDKQKIVHEVLRRGDAIAHSFVPPHGIQGYDPPTGIPYDPAEARRLLARAGYSHPDELGPVDLLYTPNDALVCQAIARMWQDRLGVRVLLRSKESKTFAEDKAHRRYMVARANWFADYNDPTTFLDCLTTGNGNNDSGYSSQEYDALMAQARAQRDLDTRAALLRAAEALIVQQDLPILPILHYAMPLAVKPYVTGLYPNPRLFFPFYTISVSR